MWKLFTFMFLCLFLTASCYHDGSGGEVAAEAKLVISSDSNQGSFFDDSSSEEDDNDNCNVEERDDDYDCSSAIARVQLAIIKIAFIRKSYFLKNNLAYNNNYCDISQKQGEEGHAGSPLASWYAFAMFGLNTKNGSKTQDKVFHLLGVKNKDECGCVMKLMKRSNKSALKGFFNYSFSITSSLRYIISEIFKIDSRVYANAFAFNCDYSKPEYCAKKINKMAAVQTGNVIREVIPRQKASTVFKPNQSIINVQAIELKPTLKMSFNMENQTTGIYYGIKPMMTKYLNQYVIYNSTQSTILNSLFMKIPLQNEGNYLLVIKPNKKCDLQYMIEKVASEPQIFIDQMKCLVPRLIYLSIPVFKSIKTVENVRSALRSTCDIDSVLDGTKAQLVDSCDRLVNNVSISYIYEKSTIILPPSGVEKYKKPSSKDSAACGSPLNVRINYPALFLYMNYNTVLEAVIGEVEQVED